jgi:hypothetical protein
MLSNDITTTAGAANATYGLVSRLGMSSIRREDGVPSREGSVLKISNTIDLGNPTAKNRHLVQFSWKDDNADGIASYEGTVHVVISRDKNVTDDKLKDKLLQLGELISTTAIVDDILIGGN